MDYIAAIFTRLLSDATLASLVDSFGGSPAVFSGDVVPTDYEFDVKPAVIIGPTLAAPHRDTFTENARAPSVSVRLYGLAGESSKAIDDAAERVRALLHRWKGPPSCTVATGPQAANTSGPAVAGRELVVSAFFTE